MAAPIGRLWAWFAVAGAFVLVLGACSPPRAIEAAGLLSGLAGGDEPEAGQTVRRTIRGEATGDVLGDLYWPGEDQAEAALVLVPGAAPEGKDDPRLVRFAHALAEARFAILVPEISSLRALQVRPQDVDAIAAAVRALAPCIAADGPGALGVAAISYAAGPAILAALQPETRDLVGFIVAIGGYHDLEAVVTFFTTGYFRGSPDEPWQYRRPNAYGKWLFVRANAKRLAAAEDRRALRAIARRKLDDLDADVSDLAGDLGPEGRAVMALLANDRPGRVPELIADLPEAVRADLAALDLERHDLSDIQAEVILIHGRDDPIIPATESEALAAALPEQQVDLFVVDNLAHVDLGATGVFDALELWRAAYRVLSARDAAPAPLDPAPCAARLVRGDPGGVGPSGPVTRR